MLKAQSSAVLRPILLNKVLISLLPLLAYFKLKKGIVLWVLL